MKKHLIVVLLLCLTFAGFAARKALVIGNANYTDAPLRNPVNDANLVSAKLTELGFDVTKITNANQKSMDKALGSFASGLTDSDEAVFYYSGHGANVDGINYLIPVGREIYDEEDLPYNAFNCNLAMDKLQRAKVSVMVLDACRDNPFRGVRSGSKGLASMQCKAGSQYIIFATEQGKTASDGSGKNSPFTESFVKYLGEPLKVEDMMRKVIAEVKGKTSDKQIPWALGSLAVEFRFARATDQVPTTVQPSETKAPQVQKVHHYGSITVTSAREADVYLDGNFVDKVSPAASLEISNVMVGNHTLEARASGSRESKSLYVSKGQQSPVHYSWIPDNMVYVEGGSFQMGSNDGYSAEKPVHQVTVKSFYIGKYVVTQAEFAQYLQPGLNWNDNWGVGDNYPAYFVSWYAAIKYCNLRSLAEGLTPCYSIGGSTNPSHWGVIPKENNDATWDAVKCDFSANGYRLPTEAEWEFAAKGGKMSHGYEYSGSNDIGSVAWYKDNSGDKNHVVGTKAANELGIYDISGNVNEWCWDWYSSSYYNDSPRDDPTGPNTGQKRLLRGGSWSFNAAYCRVAYRNFDPPYKSNYDNVGLRLCRTAN